MRFLRRISGTPLLPLLLGLALAGPSGCASKPVDENDPAQLMADAEEDIKSDHYQIAVDKLRAIKNRFPYSKQAVDAQLRIADVYFLQEAYGEAAIAYEAFKDLHPNHAKTPYAMYRVALSYFNDIPSTVARDMSSAKRSLEAYEAFIQRFPNAPEAKDAREKIASVRQKLAEKELYVGSFYFRRSFYETAKHRYEKVVEAYPDTQAAQEAQQRLASIEQRVKEGKSLEKEEELRRNRQVPASGISSPLRPPSIMGPGQ